MEPIKFADGMPVYTLDQINIYGEPYLWGVDAYLVISTFDNEKPPMSDWNFEQERRGSVRPIHRYIRQKRFEYTLYQLLGYRGTVPISLVTHLKEYGYDKRPEYVWESIRKFLKDQKYSNVYYNRIPTIMQMLGLNIRIDVDDNSQFIQGIVDAFRVANEKFERLVSKPKYFPNMRFIALKFLELYGADIQFHIPFIRTKRKLKPLEKIWNSIL